MTDARLLTINAGSSSLKAAVYPPSVPAEAEITARADRIGAGGGLLRIWDARGKTLHESRENLADHPAAVGALLDRLRPFELGFAGIGHRIVHGGARYRDPVEIDPAVLSHLRMLAGVDPAHMPQAVAAVEGERPDVVLGCAGDIPTLETVAAALWLRLNAPELKVRVVNVVDLMALFPREFHPHGMDETRFVELFTADKPVVFAFHGYQRAIHEIVHGHADVDRFHVRGFNEQGTTTTPFSMVVLNGMSRFHLAAEALRCAGEADPGSPARDLAPTLVAECEARIAQATAYAREHLEDPPEIRDWRWTAR